MKILLIKSERLLETERWVVNPLGIMSLASAAQQEGHQVDLLDLRLETTRKVWFILDQALAKLPEFIGFSALSHQAPMVQRVAKYVRECLPGAFQAAGGPIASTDADFLLRQVRIDACIIGEGEETLLHLLNVLSQSGKLDDIPGLALRHNDQVAYTAPGDFLPDLDQLPLPAWDMIDLNRYARFLSMSMRYEKRASLQTSRGCPYHCTFCHNLFGKRFRGRSPNHVLEEMIALRNSYGVRHFELIDDIFNANRPRAVAILEGIRDRLPDASISFPNGIRGDLMDREFIHLLKQAHCRYIVLAVETASPRLQIETGKGINLEKVRQAALWLREERIYTAAFFMVGFPGETAEEIEQTFTLAAEFPVDLPHVSVVIPYRNTPIWEHWVPEDLKWRARDSVLDPHYGFAEADFAASPAGTLRERSLSLARRRIFSRPNNWFVIWNEIRYRAVHPWALACKLMSLVVPRRFRRRLAEKSNPYNLENK